MPLRDMPFDHADPEYPVGQRRDHRSEIFL